jgi:hypothetical protein
MRIFIIISRIIILSSLFGSANAQGINKHNYVNKKQQVKSIDDVYATLSKSGALKNREIHCELLLFETDKGVNKYVAKIASTEVLQSIIYISQADNKVDLFIIGPQKFYIQNKIDPLSLLTYLILRNNKRYLCFIGKGQSASGTGVQVSFFNVFELDKLGKATSHFEFNSRFGNIHNIIDYNNNVSYFKIVNGKKIDQYVLTVNDIRSGKRINNGLVLLGYKLNNKFLVLNDTFIPGRK